MCVMFPGAVSSRVEVFFCVSCVTGFLVVIYTFVVELLPTQLYVISKRNLKTTQ